MTSGGWLISKKSHKSITLTLYPFTNTGYISCNNMHFSCFLHFQKVQVFLHFLNRSRIMVLKNSKINMHFLRLLEQLQKFLYIKKDKPGPTSLCIILYIFIIFRNKCIVSFQNPDDHIFLFPTFMMRKMTISPCKGIVCLF